VSPFAALRPCGYPGCAALTDAGRCDRHRKQERKEYDRQRGYPATRGYNYDWHIASKAHLARNPLCVQCMKKRRIVAATVTDHIVPHKGDPALFWDPNNWQSMCKSCHDRKTASRDHRWG
jgi:5-methylcytosine-specific restriction protein A